MGLKGQKITKNCSYSTFKVHLEPEKIVFEFNFGLKGHQPSDNRGTWLDFPLNMLQA